jgi:flagella basal body P-ring formation protein FlgA
MARILVTFAAVMLLAAPAWAAGITVAVNAEATVSGPHITLGELATVTGDDRDRVKALSALRLGTAPAPGHRIALTRDTLGVRLANAGGDYNEITWQVPPTITVITAAQTVGSERLLAAATEAVRSLGSSDADGEISIVPIGPVPDVMAPLGRLDIKAEVPGGVHLSAPTTVAVAISTDGQPFTTVTVRFRVKGYEQVVVAARNIAAREAITAENVRSERREIGKMTGYITDIEKVVGLAARRPIMAGMPLTEAVVDKPVVMKRGAAVTILVKAGEMIVAAGGQALQEGREGELIRVQNATTKRIVNARVVDANTVQVKIYGGR